MIRLSVRKINEFDHLVSFKKISHTKRHSAQFLTELLRIFGLHLEKIKILHIIDILFQRNLVSKYPSVNQSLPETD